MEDKILKQGLTLTTSTMVRFTSPLQIQWNPQEDISVYELSLCLHLLFRMNHAAIMPYEIDSNLPHMRHFIIYDPNK